MKGMFAILGCLLAAYAAPLFANQLPLIMEETIELPFAYSNWDIVPTWNDGYFWLSGASVTDSTSIVYFGNSLQGSSLNTDTIYGRTLALKGFLDPEYRFCMVLSTNRFYQYEDPPQADSITSLDTTWVRFETLPGRESLVPTYEFHGRGVYYHNGIYEVTERNTIKEHAIDNIEAIPAAPDTMRTLAGHLRWFSSSSISGRYNGYGDNLNGRAVINVFQRASLDTAAAGRWGYHSEFLQTGGQLYCAMMGSQNTSSPSDRYSYFYLYAGVVDSIGFHSQFVATGSVYDLNMAPGRRLALTSDTGPLFDARVLYMFPNGSFWGGVSTNVFVAGLSRGRDRKLGFAACTLYRNADGTCSSRFGQRAGAWS